jgi:hypothetical protein
LIRHDSEAIARAVIELYEQSRDPSFNPLSLS